MLNQSPKDVAENGLSTLYHFDGSQLFRLILTILFGFFVAGFLTWFMYVLIQSSEQKLDKSQRVQMLDFVRLKRQEISEQKERRPERPPISEAPPAPATPELQDASDVDAISIADLGINTNIELNMDGFSVGRGDGEYLPIVKVSPLYPVSASARGLEGECMVEYTVTTSGSTRDITVVEEKCPLEVFRRTSIEAAKKFKYKPRVLNGEAVEVHKVRNKFIYKLDDEKQKE